MEEPLIKPKVPRRKKSAKAINTRNKKLWGTLKRTVSTAVASDENVFVHSQTANTYVDVPPSFSDADYEMSNEPTLLNGECDGNTYFQAAFLLAHSSPPDTREILTCKHRAPMCTCEPLSSTGGGSELKRNAQEGPSNISFPP